MVNDDSERVFSQEPGLGEDANIEDEVDDGQAKGLITGPGW